MSDGAVLTAWPFAPHWLVDGVIAFTLAEAVCLSGLHRWRGRGVPPREFLANMASGLCLMAALRVALTDGPPAAVAAWLVAAGSIHAFDLWRRWR